MPALAHSLAAVALTGVIWMRYSLVIIPKNLNLFAVVSLLALVCRTLLTHPQNAAMAVTGSYQLSRKVTADYL